MSLPRAFCALQCSNVYGNDVSAVPFSVLAQRQVFVSRYVCECTVQISDLVCIFLLSILAILITFMLT